MTNYVSNYNKFPAIVPKYLSHDCRKGWDDVCAMIGEHIDNIKKSKKIIAFECYPGLHNEIIIKEFSKRLGNDFIFTSDFFLEEEKINELIHPDVTDDALFGRITSLKLQDFFDIKKMSAFKEIINNKPGTIFIYGPGATVLLPEPDLFIYLDMPRWEGQLRFRRNEVGNLGINNKNEKGSLQYKQAFYVDWRIADQHKRATMAHWDLILDTTNTHDPKITTGQAIRNAYDEALTQPFRLMPFFDPGPWGGQWMKKVCNLDASQPNYAWCFDCVPEENSLLINFNNIIFETPAINLVFYGSKKLLGEAVQAKFGDEFPIRFDFLDTMDGGNLSLQVHPTNEYIREQFRMPYTQDESYYILDAAPGAIIYLGLKKNISSDEMLCDLYNADAGKELFDADKYVATFPVKKHDHYLIPAGTIHCSGKNSMVLEISATPYMFTFKLWDWGRLGLDGKPRPINIGHGKNVIDWTRTTPFVKRELINQFEKINEGDGWIEERTGLHATEFIETRRHWFTSKVLHKTNGTVNVLNLVEGKEVLVESPTNAFEPFVVHYAETFIVPAQVDEYCISPLNPLPNTKYATIKAFVRP